MHIMIFVIVCSVYYIAYNSIEGITFTSFECKAETILVYIRG